MDASQDLWDTNLSFDEENQCTAAVPEDRQFEIDTGGEPADPIEPTKDGVSVDTAPSGSSKQKTSHIPAYTESFLQRVLEQVRNGAMTVYHAQKYYGVPRATLQYRLKADFKIADARCFFTKAEERKLVCSLLTQQKVGVPITRQDINNEVKRFLKGKKKPPSRRWLEYFLQRYPQISMNKEQAVATLTEESLVTDSIKIEHPSDAPKDMAAEACPKHQPDVPEKPVLSIKIEPPSDAPKDMAAEAVPNPQPDVPKKHVRKQQYSETFLQEIVEEIKNGYITFHEAHKKYGIQRKTLQCRMNKEFKEKCQLPTAEEEQLIVARFQEQAKNGFPVTRERVISQARHWCRGRQKKLDKRWLNGFISRYPDLVLDASQAVTTINASSSSTEATLNTNTNGTPTNPSDSNKQPKKRIRKRIKQDYTEEFLQSVLEKIRNGTMTQYSASKFSGIPRQTLNYRLSDMCRNKLTVGPFTMLSKEEELEIVGWLQEMERKGFKITRQRLTFRASGYKQFSQKGPARHWEKSFLKRHPQLDVKAAQFSKAESQQTTQDWFQTVEEYLLEHDLADVLKNPSRVLLGDESWFCIASAPTGFLATKGNKRLPTALTARQNLTVLFSFAADGTVFPPDVILCSKRAKGKITQYFPDNWVIGKSDTGRLDSKNFTRYVRRTLVPYLKSKGVKFPVVYFVDDAKSQAAFESADACAKLGIIIIALYTGASRILQPSDMTVFGLLKNSWDNKTNKIRSTNEPQQLPMATFGHLLSSAVTTAFDISSIVGVFRACGLYPFSPSTAYYSQCVAKYKTGSDDTGEVMTLIPSAVIQTALRMIGEEKISLFKVGNQTNFSPEDRALLFIYKNILTVGKADPNIVTDSPKPTNQALKTDVKTEYSEDDSSETTEDNTNEATCNEIRMTCCVRDCFNPNQKWATEFPRDDDLQARWKAAIQFGTGQSLPDTLVKSGALVCNMHFVIKSSSGSLDVYREPSLFIRNNVLVEVTNCRLCFQHDLIENMLDMEDCLKQGNLLQWMVSKYDNQIESITERKEDRYFCKKCTARAVMTDAFEEEICYAVNKYMKLLVKIAMQTLAMKSTGPLPREEMAETFVKNESEDIIDNPSNETDVKMPKDALAEKCTMQLENEGFENLSNKTALPLENNEFTGEFVENTADEIIIKDESVPDTVTYEVEMLGDDFFKDEPQLAESEGVSDVEHTPPDKKLTKKVQKNKRWKKCYICNTILESRISLSRHLLLDHSAENNTLRCEVCSLHFNETINYNRHLATHDTIGHKPSEVLEQHIEQLFICEHCEKPFPTQALLNRHNRKCSVDKVKWRQQTNPKNWGQSKLPNGQALVAQLINHKKMCNVCQESFRQSREVVTHFTEVHPDLNLHYFPCSECENVYFSQARLVTHKDSHTDKYACQQCGKRHKSQADLLQHQRSKQWLDSHRTSLKESTEETQPSKANAPGVEI